MYKKYSFPIFLISVCSFFVCNAQVEGLWEVKQVQVGAQSMTPVAKWFLLNPDKTIESGNGGVINIEGTWQVEDKGLTFYNPNGVADPYGAFQLLAKDNSKMTWKREEEGETVTINLKKVKQKPKAPWDKVVGFWLLKEAKEKEVDVTKQVDPDDDRFIFIRWDRRFSSNYVANKKENHRGFWHIESHYPYLRLFSEKGDLYNTGWDIIFEGQTTMKWINKNEKKEWIFELRAE